MQRDEILLKEKLSQLYLATRGRKQHCRTDFSLEHLREKYRDAKRAFAEEVRRAKQIP